jgi:ATPase family associated with various cellular activities (AAA)
MADDVGFDRQSFASAFARFIDTMNTEAVPVVSPVRQLALDALGVDPSELPVVSEEVAVYDVPNLQLAFDRWLGDGGGRRAIVANGLAAPGFRYMGLELGDLVSRQAQHGGAIELGPIQYSETRLPAGERLLCYETALLSIVDDGEPLVALIARGQQRRPGSPPLQLQVMARDREVAAGFLGELRRLRHLVNVYRGQVLAVAQGDVHDPFGNELALQLVESAAISRTDLVLPDGVLERIERHTVEFGRHAARLRAAGRALRRGVLLYGPPGTGKTHTVRFLSSAMEGRTTFIISGAAFGVLAPICQLARDLAPAMVVLEDVDLVALERTMPGPGRSPLLFSLMNEMDGIGSDADVVFLLTTNRADLIEPALAARPGRIDLAIEIPVPDRQCRERLVELYGRGLSMHSIDLAGLLDRTEGVSAAFIKELLRRAALIAAAGSPVEAHQLEVGGPHVTEALDEMLSDGGRLTRSILGAGAEIDGEDQFVGVPPGVAVPQHLRSMLAGGGAVFVQRD